MNKPISEWLHRPFLLNEEELADPSITISNFLHNRKLPEHRETLWYILKAALVSSRQGYATAEELADWVIYFRHLEAFIEASFELLQNQNKNA